MVCTAACTWLVPDPGESLPFPDLPFPDPDPDPEERLPNKYKTKEHILYVQRFVGLVLEIRGLYAGVVPHKP